MHPTLFLTEGRCDTCMHQGNRKNIVLDNGVQPIQHQAIIASNGGFWQLNHKQQASVKMESKY